MVKSKKSTKSLHPSGDGSIRAKERGRMVKSEGGGMVKSEQRSGGGC